MLRAVVDQDVSHRLAPRRRYGQRRVELEHCIGQVSPHSHK
jgi:hypothetical protein